MIAVRRKIPHVRLSAPNLLAKIKPSPMATVVWYGKVPRVARIPLEEARKLPPEARKTFDNTTVRFQWALMVAGILGAVGALIGVMSLFLAGEAPSPASIVRIIIPPVMLAAFGWYLGHRYVSHLFYQQPMYWFRVVDGRFQAVVPDEAMDLRLVAYFEDLRQAIVDATGDEERSDTLIDPLKTGLVTARWDPVSMGFIERMENERMDASGGMDFRSKALVAGATGILVIAFLALGGFAMVIGNEKAKLLPTQAEVTEPIGYVRLYEDVMRG